MKLPETPSWLTVALAGAGGFLVGVLLIAVLGGPKGVTRTTTETRTQVKTETQTRTSTVTRTVESGTDVPDVTGQLLSNARDTLEGMGFNVELANDPTFFGVQNEKNFVVVGQDPPAGTKAAAGATVSVEIDRA